MEIAQIIREIRRVDFDFKLLFVERDEIFVRDSAKSIPVALLAWWDFLFTDLILVVSVSSLLWVVTFDFDAVVARTENFCVELSLDILDRYNCFVEAP